MYAELHARSAFSFLRGAAQPEDLVKAACHLELPAMALLDRDGVCGAPRFFGPARENGLRARVGAEITMEDGCVIPLLALSQTGYQNLCQLITESKLTERSPQGVEISWGRGDITPLQATSEAREPETQINRAGSRNSSDPHAPD